MEKIYTDYDEYLQDAYEEQLDKYIQQHERTQEATRQQGNTGKDLNFSAHISIPGV